MKTNMVHIASQEDGPKQRTGNFGPEFLDRKFSKIRLEILLI